jgi:hypothetical protein
MADLELPNSVVPTTLGGLLAEEWTIDPYSAVPSFLERIFIQEAQDSSYQGLESALEALLEFSERWTLAWLTRRRHETTEGTSASAHRPLLHWNHPVWERARERLVRRVRQLTHVVRRHRIEVVALAVYTIERAFLHKANSTLAESFYGGHRVQIVAATSATTSQGGKARGVRPLETRDKTRLAALLALSVLVKGKFEASYRDWKGRPQSLLSTEQKLFVLAYPWTRTAYQSIAFVCQWNYLIGTSPFFDVPSLLLQQWVRRVTKDDTAVSSPDKTVTATPAVKTPPLDPTRLVQRASLATTAALAVSWLTWCRATWQQLARQGQRDKGHILPPPELAEASSSSTDGACCVCGTRPPVQPGACTVSGCVGCATCLQSYLERHGQCPVTRQMCPPSSWVRLYEPHS